MLIEEKDAWSFGGPRWYCLETKAIVRAISGLCGAHIDKDTKDWENKTDERTEDGMELLPLTPKA